MKQELMQLDHDIASSIILRGDLSGLTPDQRTQYVVYRSRTVGLDPACQPFILMDSNGKVVIYATKEAAAQLNQLRRLSPVVSKEEFLMENSVYKVTYRVTEDGRATEDCGAVGLVKIKKGINGKPDESRKMTPDEVADAIMKAHTKGKRRAILTHCGIGTNDHDEVPLIVPDREEIKQADAAIKDTSPTKEDPKPEPDPKAETVKREKKPKADDVLSWTGKLVKVDSLELDGGVKAYSVKVEDGKEFKTTDKTFASFAEGLIREGRAAIIAYKPNARGSLVVRSFLEAE